MAKFAECDDYVNSIQVPQLIKASKLENGSPEMNKFRPVMYTGGYCAVFPFITENRKYAVRCWHASLNDTQTRTCKIAEYISKVKLPYFVDFEYVEEGIATSKGVMPIVIMDWVDAKPLKTYIAEIINNSSALELLASNFLLMVKELHVNGISHGDLQHGNIMVRSNGNLVLVDYDSMYVPSLKGYPNEISGLRGYQHPARWTTKEASPKADYFSELIIYTSIIALSIYPELWDDLQIYDKDTLIFSSEDITSKGVSEIFVRLSKDFYLKELVDLIRDALTFSSIEDLKPLESIEPNVCREKEKNLLVDEIRNLIDNLNDVEQVEKIRRWLLNVDYLTFDQIKEKYSEIQEYIKRIKKINELREGWKNNGYKLNISKPFNSEPVIEEQRNQWNENSIAQQTSTYTSSKKNDVDDTRNEWS